MAQAPPKPGIAPVELAISCVFSVFFTTNALLDLSADLWALDAPRARLAFLRDWYVFRQWSPIVSPLMWAWVQDHYGKEAVQQLLALLSALQVREWTSSGVRNLQRQCSTAR